ncbi:MULTISPECIES: pilus assembly protein TadG-related protein [Gordonibacter]|uniref:Flp pilus-assembly TadG-like N-terminal domain-containing protein n=1 Tax=Gordonibacter faecis TaxID=3047475 RepID=A0ABT7DL79_9ACTN|nr:MULTISPECIES: pilus assembly protein TadG-related protein [unclassified Gordonibacter]MDJ1650280.1 hypothetical protein [Gordonibacter sp. KGMB12511]HIW76874.1 hypothetical protein [Candidatus Gordonibacter avicola]
MRVRAAGARSAASERGNVTPLALAVALVLFMALGFAVDQGVACASKVRQENALDAARDACMDTSFALVAKNDNDPGLAVARRLTQTLRDEGYQGGATVWFYEVPASALPRSRRVWGVAVQLEEDVPTVIARGFGVVSLPVASKRIVTAEPYADVVAWRPVGTQSNARFQLRAGMKVSSLSRVRLGGLGDYPEELQQRVRAMTADATGRL